jgi:nucleotide-binding universal stress UspA family protein
MRETILVPLDGSEFSEHILDWLGPRVGKATRVVLVRVVPTFGTSTEWAGFGAWTPTAAVDSEQMSVDAREEARAYLEKVATRLGDAAEVKIVAIAGDPGPEILEAARRYRADVIAMASHGRASLGRKLIGSVAEYVLQRATVPLFLAGPRSFGPRPVAPPARGASQG